MNDPLAKLKDIHLPPDPSWWPPAPGWWLLAGLGLVLLFFLGLYLRRQRMAQQPVRLALRELAAIETKGLESTAARRLFLEKLTILLRRFCLVWFPEKDIAGLAGTRWLEFLAQQAPDNAPEKWQTIFAPLLAIYSSDRHLEKLEFDPAALKENTARWLRGQLKKGGKGGGKP